MAQLLTITQPVVDLRKAPENLSQGDFSHNPLRISQLLYNETLELIEENGEWLFVGALEQECYDAQKGWHPYPGWVHRSEVKPISTIPSFVAVVHTKDSPLSFGTYLTAEDDLSHARPLSISFSQETLKQDALLFVGAPYLWGGRSSYPHGSVDCSSLIDLLFRAQSISIPRDAADQFRKACEIPFPAAPLYLAREKRINHVILPLDPNTYIESPETGKSVHLLTYRKELAFIDSRLHIKGRPHSYAVHKIKPFV